MKPEERLKRRSEIGQQRRARTRNQLIEAAMGVVATQGVETPVIDDFIGAAGVARGTFYNHFKTKEELFEALSDRLHDSFRHAIDQVRAGVEDPAERLIFPVRHILHRAATDHQWGWLVIHFRFEDPRLQATLRAGPHEDVRAAAQDGRIKIEDLEVGTDMLVGALHEAVRATLTGKRSESMPEQVATFILAGLGLPYEEAYRVARRDLPEVVAP